MDISSILLTFGVPGSLFGILVWYFKRSIEKRDKRQMEQEQNIEQLMLMIMKSNRANSVLCSAIARAVQRIPDAHCNGDMTKALEVVDEYNKEEKDFLLKQGIKHIFE